MRSSNKCIGCIIRPTCWAKRATPFELSAVFQIFYSFLQILVSFFFPSVLQSWFWVYIRSWRALTGGSLLGGTKGSTTRILPQPNIPNHSLFLCFLGQQVYHATRSSAFQSYWSLIFAGSEKSADLFPWTWVGAQHAGRAIFVMEALSIL